MNKRQLKELDRTGRSVLRLHTLGAARAVTGSLFLYEFFEKGKVTRFIADIGLTVENPAVDYQKRLPAGINASDIAFAIISHAHVDHSGYLPKLIKDGFKGPVFCTPATKDLLGVILPDSGFLQEEEAKRAKKRIERDLAAKAGGADASAAKTFTATRGRGKKAASAAAAGATSESANVGGSLPRGVSKAALARTVPLYTMEEAKASLHSLKTVPYGSRFQASESVWFTFTDAGHLLGSAVVNLEIGTGSQKRTFSFPSNIGRPGTPLLRDLEPIKGADYVMVEATYGNRLHPKRDRLEALGSKLNAAYERAKKRNSKTGCGVILIPAFAVGRAQAILNDIRLLMEGGQLPIMPVFVDGRMTLAATEVHTKHAAILNDETRRLIESGKDPFATPRHHLVEDWKASEALRRPHDEPIIIVGSSGMANGGRIVNHLSYWLSGRENTVVFVGYQGSGTLGQAIVRASDGERPDSVVAPPNTPKTVRVSGKVVRLNATIEFVSDYSGHADKDDTVNWLRKFNRPPKTVFINHGDDDALAGLKEHIEKSLGWKNVVIPGKGDVFEL